MLLPAALLPAVLLLACANPGPPKPPTLHLPEPAKGLSAERVGDHVVLSWQTPTVTTDGETIRGPIRAQICRDDSPKPPPSVPVFPVSPDSCKLAEELQVASSTAAAPTRVEDRLPASLAAGAPRLVAYRVTLLNAKGRSTGSSAPIFALAGAAPAAVGTIEITTERGGALIRWQTSRQAPGAPMQVVRTLLANAAGPVETTARRAKGSGPGNSRAGQTVEPVTLTPDRGAPGDVDAMVDRGIHDGDTVRYVAERVLTVELTPPPAIVVDAKGKIKETRPVAQEFELKSDPSPPAIFTLHDTIPPSAPEGLIAVTGGGFGEAPSIDLSWEANSELDIAGYNLYRAGADSRFAKLNGALVPGPEFRDTTATVGGSYLYRVTAVDAHGNESAPSTAVKASVRR